MSDWLATYLTLVLVTTAVFLLAKAVHLRRESRLGRAMAASNTAMAAGLLWAVAGRVAPGAREATVATTVLWTGVLLAVLWGMVELRRSRRA